jgi:hypothetical protein
LFHARPYAGTSPSCLTMCWFARAVGGRLRFVCVGGGAHVVWASGVLRALVCERTCCRQRLSALQQWWGSRTLHPLCGTLQHAALRAWESAGGHPCRAGPRVHVVLTPPPPPCTALCACCLCHRRSQAAFPGALWQSCADPSSGTRPARLPCVVHLLLALLRRACGRHRCHVGAYAASHRISWR